MVDQKSEPAGTSVPDAQVTAIEEELLHLRLHMGRTAWRLKLAEALVEQGLTHRDLVILGDYATGTTENPYRAAALLGWFFKQPDRWKALVADLRKARAKRARGENLPQLNKEFIACVTPEEYARCRIRHEQASREMTAEELGVTPQELDEILGEGSE
jgi:hypothetical protein